MIAFFHDFKSTVMPEWRAESDNGTAAVYFALDDDDSDGDWEMDPEG